MKEKNKENKITGIKKKILFVSFATREILRNIGDNQYKNALYQIFTHLSEKQDLSREEYLMFNSLLYLWNMTY